MSGSCTSPGSPCTADCLSGYCNEALDQCYVLTGFCYLDEVCYADGFHNPENPCLVCDAALSHVWTADDSASCDDGDACTHTDHCSGGSCTGTAYSCDDGLSCTRDRCDGQGSCTHPLWPMSCLIDGVCYGRWEDNPANPCQECRDDWGTYYETHWGWDNAATCMDDGLFCTTVHYCDDGVCRGNAPDPCDDVCGTCNESTDTCDNVPGPCDDGLFCNGTDSCENATCSQHSGNPCPDDGQWCNGEEACNEPLRRCEQVNIPDCSDDGIYCNGAEFCNEDINDCDVRDVPECPDDGLFCTGEEYCNEDIDDCDSGGDPCWEYEYCCEDGDYCSNDPCEGPCGPPELWSISPDEGEEDTTVHVEISGQYFTCEPFGIKLWNMDTGYHLWLQGLEVVDDGLVTGLFDLGSLPPGTYDVYLFALEHHDVIEDGFVVIPEPWQPICGVWAARSPASALLALAPFLSLMMLVRVLRRRR